MILRLSIVQLHHVSIVNDRCPMYPIIQTCTEIQLKFSRNRTRRVRTMKEVCCKMKELKDPPDTPHP